MEHTAKSTIISGSETATLSLDPNSLFESNPDTVYINIGGTSLKQLFPDSEDNALCISFNPEFDKIEPGSDWGGV